MITNTLQTLSPEFGPATLDTPSATELLLDILSLLDKAVLTTSQIQRAGDAFGFSPITMRTATSRLCDRGELITLERGTYALPSNTSAARQFIRNWPNVLDETTHWNGDWLLAIIPRTADAPRASVRGMDKLLIRYGFWRWQASLYVRPANLAGGIERMRAHIGSWRHGQNVTLATLSDIEDELADTFFGAWEGCHPDYESLAARLRESRVSLPGLPEQKAAAEALSLGRCGVKTILADPRLPEPHGNRKGLAALLDEMRAYERYGQAIWVRYLGIDDNYVP